MTQSVPLLTDKKASQSNSTVTGTVQRTRRQSFVYYVSVSTTMRLSTHATLCERCSGDDDGGNPARAKQ